MVETIIGIAAGLIITIIISRYYYRLSVRHRLSVYVLQAFQVMSDVDRDIKKDFTVKFKDTQVKNLTILELLIVNQGTHPIRDCVEPLAIEFPEGTALLDATVPYVNPEGRHVRAEVISDRRFEYHFSILNPREYFLTKIVADGFIDLERLLITIGADNLPPRLMPRIGDRVETERHTKVVLGVNLIGAIVTAFFGLFAVSVLSLVQVFSGVQLWDNLPSPYPTTMVGTIAFVLLILNAVLCLGFILAILFGGAFPPSHRFPLPESVRGNDQPIRVGLGLFVGKDEEPKDGD